MMLIPALAALQKLDLPSSKKYGCWIDERNCCRQCHCGERVLSVSLASATKSIFKIIIGGAPL